MEIMSWLSNQLELSPLGKLFADFRRSGPRKLKDWSVFQKSPGKVVRIDTECKYAIDDNNDAGARPGSG